MGLPRASWVKLNRLRTGVGCFYSSMYKWGLAISPNCECGATDQTADHIISTCPIHRAPRGVTDLRVYIGYLEGWLIWRTTILGAGLIPPQLASDPTKKKKLADVFPCIRRRLLETMKKYFLDSLDIQKMSTGNLHPCLELSIGKPMKQTQAVSPLQFFRRFVFLPFIETVLE